MSRYCKFKKSLQKRKRACKSCNKTLTKYNSLYGMFCNNDCKSHYKIKQKSYDNLNKRNEFRKYYIYGQK